MNKHKIDKFVEKFEWVLVLLRDADIAYRNGEDSYMTDDLYDELERYAIAVITGGLVIDNLYKEEDPLILLSNIIYYNRRSEKVKHASFVQSLMNQNNGLGIVKDWDNAINQLVEKTYSGYKKDQHYLISSLKIDGIAFEAVYNKGKLISVSTKGDGEKGSCLMRFVKGGVVNGFPLSYEGTIYEQKNHDFVIHGEFYIKKANRPAGTTSPLRNVVAGALLRKRVTSEMKGLVDFVTYKYMTKIKHLPEHNSISGEYLISENFNIDFDKSIHKIPEQKTKYTPSLFLENMTSDDIPLISNTYNSIINKLYELPENKTLDADVDGIVLRMDISFLRSALGISKVAKMEKSGKYSRLKLAFKMGMSEGKSTVTNVVWNISKHGVYTPVVQIEPIVASNGVIINRINLSNYKKLLKMNIGRDDIVEIELAGSIIPVITKVVGKYKKDAFDVPVHCLSCKHELSKTKTEIYCPNFYCENKQKDIVMNFANLCDATKQFTKNLPYITDREYYIHKNQTENSEGIYPEVAFIVYVLENATITNLRISVAEFLKAVNTPNLGDEAFKQLSGLSKREQSFVLRFLESRYLDTSIIKGLVDERVVNVLTSALKNKDFHTMIKQLIKLIEWGFYE